MVVSIPGLNKPFVLKIGNKLKQPAVREPNDVTSIFE